MRVEEIGCAARQRLTGLDAAAVRARAVLSGRAEQAYPGDVEAHLSAHPLQERDVPLPVVAEMEVVPHDHRPSVEAPDEHLGHEVLCPFGGPLGVEVNHQGQVGPARRQQRKLLIEVGQQQRRRLRPHHAGRVRVERHHAGHGPDLGGRAVGPLR